MKKFIVLYHVPLTALEAMKNSDSEETKKAMEQWMEWAKKCGDRMVDLGNPLGNATKVTPTGNTKTTSTVAGYSIVQAETREEATKLFDEHPHLNWNEACSIELHEVLPLPGTE